jgi:hypothetical protein
MLTGCVGMAEEERDEDGDLVDETVAIDTHCPPSAPPCDCALKGTSQCADPDGDGVRNLSDNCDYAYNPNQANCDGDTRGDACDSLNETVTTFTDATWDYQRPLGNNCLRYYFEDRGYRRSMLEYIVNVRTYETHRRCGPSGTGDTQRITQDSYETVQ